MGTPGLAPYLDHLRALPFVRGVRVATARPRAQLHADYELVLRTDTAEKRLLVEVKTSHVSPEVIERWATVVGKARNRLLFAPAIGQRLGDRLTALGLGFVDRAGNCYVNVSGRHIARIQGRRGEQRPSAEKGLRAPAYRALFALLADPKLAGAPVRALADAAGVSRQAAADIRHRLEAVGFLYARKDRFGWFPRAVPKAIDLFITGYVTTLRPQLLLGRYRTPASNPDDLQRSVRRAMKSADGGRWGGGAAAMKLTGYYRGTTTILHMDNASPDLLRRIKAVPDREGPLHLVRVPGPIALRGETADTVHPLLVYAELMLENHDRASETAQQILERWLSTERYV